MQVGGRGDLKGMPRLFHRNEWFFELSPTALAESEFESLLVQNAEIIRPGHRIVPFKKTAYASDRSARADLAIIADDYRHWTVVEVEMIRHDLHSHVIPQIRTLSEASYTAEHAQYLAARAANFNAQKLTEMMRGEAPEVLVLVNKPDDEWAREIRRYGAHMMVFEIFRSTTSNRHIFAIDGELPNHADDVLSELSFGLLPRLLAVSSPAALNFLPGEQQAVFIDNQVTYWERFDTATSCYLTPVGNMPIKPGSTYALVRTDAGQLAIRQIRQKGA